MFASIRRNVTWRAIPIAGVVAGTVFLLAAAILMPLLYQVSPGLVLRYFASLVLGSGVLTQGNAFTLVVGVLVHYTISIIAALVIAIVVHRWGLWVGIFGGALLGLAIYGINIYAMTRYYEWFFAINSPVLLLGHMLFGAVAGGVYELFDHFDLPLKETSNE